MNRDPNSTSAATGNTVLYVQGLATNAGTIALSGGAFDNNTRTLSNMGLITQDDLGAMKQVEAIYW